MKTMLAVAQPTLAMVQSLLTVMQTPLAALQSTFAVVQTPLGSENPTRLTRAFPFPPRAETPFRHEKNRRLLSRMAPS